MVELPSRPWQGAHGSGLGPPPPRAGAAPPAAGAGRPRRRPDHRQEGENDRGADERAHGLLTRVGDPVDRAGVVVGDQERPVFHLLRVHGPAPDLLTLEPSITEHLDLRHIAAAERYYHDPEADFFRPVPRAALGEEGAVLVLG